MSNSKKRDPIPTKTSLVYDVLKRCDDFITVAQLRERLATDCTINQIAASLSHLSKHKAVGSLPDDHGHLWWYATPETDTRSKEVETRTPEDKPRKMRRRKATPITF